MWRSETPQAVLWPLSPQCRPRQRCGPCGRGRPPAEQPGRAAPTAMATVADERAPVSMGTRQRLRESPSGRERRGAAAAARAGSPPCRAPRPPRHGGERRPRSAPAITAPATATVLAARGPPAEAPGRRSGPCWALNPALSRQSRPPFPGPRLSPRGSGLCCAVPRPRSVATVAPSAGARVAPALSRQWPPRGRSSWARGARAAVSARKTFSRAPRAPGRGRSPRSRPFLSRGAAAGAGGRGRCAPGARGGCAVAGRKCRQVAV